MQIPTQEILNICKAHSEGIADGMLNKKTNPYPARSPLYTAWNRGHSEGWAMRAEAITMNKDRGWR